GWGDRAGVRPEVGKRGSDPLLQAMYRSGEVPCAIPVRDPSPLVSRHAVVGGAGTAPVPESEGGQTSDGQGAGVPPDRSLSALPLVGWNGDRAARGDVMVAVALFPNCV